MASLTKTKKLANTTGYVVALGSLGMITVGLGNAGEVWVEPVANQTTAPATPTNAAIPANAGDEVNFVNITANESRTFDLSKAFAVENQQVRWTHLRIWCVTAGNLEILGA